MTLDGETIHLPRILCLHGGGVNSDIFPRSVPCHHLALQDPLPPRLRGRPFFCDAGPGIVPVYEAHGPFRRWLRWLPNHPPVDSGTAVDEIWWQLNEAWTLTTELAVTGVGRSAGFSQGAKMCASVLFGSSAERRWS